MRFVIFISILTVILGSISWYIASRIISNFSWASTHRGVVFLTLGILVVLQLAGPLLYRAYPGHFQRAFILHWAGYTTLGVLACMFFYTVASDLVSVVWRLLVGPERSVDFGRRSFFTAGAMALGSSLVGLGQAEIGPHIYKVEIPLKGLPKEFDGFRIVQITDLHVGPTIGRNYTQKVVNMANDLSPDLLALTGDFADGNVSTLKNSLQPLGQLNAKHGTFFVTGNHEYYWDVDQWLAEYRKLGIRTLMNEHVSVQQNGSELILAGVTDYSAGQMDPAHRSDPAAAIQGARSEERRVGKECRSRWSPYH